MGKEAELIKAAKRGDLKVLERYLGQQNKRGSVIGSIRKPMHPNVQDEVGYTLLHHATLNGHTEVVNFLLSCGASTTIPDSSGSYPLHLASWKGDLEIVKLLVSQGMSRPNVDQQSNSEDTALHLASQYGYCSVVEFLLERHANPMLKNIRGETPLDLAAQFGHLDTVNILISHYPELLNLSRPNISPLHLAARNGHTVVVLSLLNAGIPVNTLCTVGSALHEAALCGKEDTVKLLLDKGIDLSLKDSEERTALNLLSEIPAQKAQKIHQLISQYASKVRVPKERYMRPHSYRLLAVPVRDSKGRKVQRGASRGMESPPDKDHQEAGGADRLPCLEYREGESILIQGRQSPHTYIGLLHKVQGTFPIRDMRIFQDIEGKLHEIKKENLVEFVDEGGIHVHKQKHSDSVGKKKEKSKPKKTHKMTDQEKKFVLSKDTGTYSQLTPVSAPSSTTAEIKCVSPPMNAVGGASGKQEYLGNYYLLEVGAMDNTPPTSPSTDEREDIPSPPHYPPPQLRDDIPPPPIQAPPQPSIISKSPCPPTYENVEIKPKLPLKKRTKSFDVSPQCPTHLQVPERPRSKTSRTSSYENVPSQFASNSSGACNNMGTPLQACLSSPVDIPATVPLRQGRRSEYSGTKQACDSRGDGPEFRIVEEQSTEDVIISSLNPNYMKVVLKDRPHPVENKEEKQEEEEEPQTEVPGRVRSPGGSVWFIPQESDPFAGLVQSSSLSNDLADGPLTRNRLESIWDDQRVSQEWNQIENCISSMNTTIQEYECNLPEPDTEAALNSIETTPVIDRSPVAAWLSGVGLAGLSNVLESHGFDDVEFLGGNILTMADLKEMGIMEGDQSSIIANTVRLRPPPHVRHAQTIPEWLDLLHLPFLEDRFEGYTLEKVSRLWEMQLSTVLSIEELGYRKRLLYGVHELRAGHPEWAGSPLGSTASRLRNETGQTTSPILQHANFTKDYRNIKSLKTQNGSLESLPLEDETKLNWVEPGIQRTRNSHSTSSLDRRSETPPLPSKQAVRANPISQHYQTVQQKEGASNSNGDSVPSSVPVRGNEYATIKKEESGDARVIHPERKRVTVVPPPTEVRKYHTWYLGSAMVKGIVGKHSAEEACLKLRTQTDGIAKIPEIVLSISWKGVKFVDAESKMVVSNHLIRDISHCCPDIEDPKVFAYMTKEKETGRSYCHVFMAESKEAADEIITTVGQAFEVAYQAVIRARGHKSSSTSGTSGHSSTAAGSSDDNNKSHKSSPVKSSLKSSFRKLKQKRKSSPAQESSPSNDVS